MSFKPVTETRGKIGGFWTREEGTKVVGQVKKYVESENGGFWIILTAEGDIPLQGPEGSAGRPSVLGEIVAVSGSSALEVLRDFIGKGVVRLTSNGKKEGKKGKTFWDISVEHDAEGKPYTGPPINYNDSDIPF